MDEAKEARRKLAQDVFIRVCRDSGFQLDMFRAAALAGSALGTNALGLWTRMAIGFDVMEQIAAGTHPAAIARTKGSEA